MFKVSWLIPCYNAQSFLDAALHSVKIQSFSDFEVILVDDGSTDGTRDILNRYAENDSRFRVFGKPNGGIVSALNYGLARCSGEYIARFDADDINHADRLSKQLAFMAANPDFVAVGSRVRIIDGQDRAIHVSRRVPEVRSDVSRFPPVVPTLRHPTALFRAADLSAVGYREGFAAAEDFEMWTRMARRGRIMEIDEALISYRIHSASISAAHTEQQVDSVVRAEILAYRPALAVDLAPDRPVRRQLAVAGEAMGLETSGLELHYNRLLLERMGYLFGFRLNWIVALIKAAITAFRDAPRDPATRSEVARTAWLIARLTLRRLGARGPQLVRTAGPG